jgi:RNA recognition motif-containing protein
MPRSQSYSSSSSDSSVSPPRRRRYSTDSSDSSSSSLSPPTRSDERRKLRDSPTRKDRPSPPAYRSKTPPPVPKEEDIKEITFKGLTKAVTKEHFQEILKTYGNIIKLELDVDERTGYSRGTGIIEFEKHEEAVKAVDHLDESQIDGKLVSLRLKQPPRPPRKRSPPRSSDPRYRPYSPRRRGYARDDRYGRDYNRRRSPSPINRRYRRRSYSSSRSRSRSPPKKKLRRSPSPSKNDRI